MRKCTVVHFDRCWPPPSRQGHLHDHHGVDYDDIHDDHCDDVDDIHHNLPQTVQRSEEQMWRHPRFDLTITITINQIIINQIIIILNVGTLVNLLLAKSSVCPRSLATIT